MTPSNFDQISAIPDPTPPPTGGDTGTADTDNSTVSETTDTQTESQPTGETGTSEQSADATATQTTQAEENPYNVEVDDTQEIPKPTLDGILQTPRGKEIYQNHKIIAELAKPIEQGGIGHVPSVEQIRDYHAAYRDRVIMDHHLSSGDPKGAEAFIQFAMGKERGKGAEVVAQNLASTLASSNPDAYVAASLPFVGNYANGLWDRFKEIPPNQDGTWSPDKHDLYRAAQMVHKDITGNWMALEDLGLATPGIAKVDPLAGERQRLNEQQEQIRRERAQSDQAFTQRWDNSVASDIGTKLYSELDKALAPLKKMHESAPKLYEAARKDFHDTVLNTVRGNKHAWDMYQVRLADSRRLGTPEAAQKVSQEFMSMAVSAIKTHFREYLKQYGVVLKGTSDNRHTQLSTIDSKRDVGSNGSSPTPGKGSFPQRLPGETASDYNFRLLKS